MNAISALVRRDLRAGFLSLLSAMGGTPGEGFLKTRKRLLPDAGSI